MLYALFGWWVTDWVAGVGELKVLHYQTAASFEKSIKFQIQSPPDIAYLYCWE